MAKRSKAKSEVQDQLNAVDAVFQELQAELPWGLPEVDEYLTTGARCLDKAISGDPFRGGFPVGRLTEVIGTEGAGKSTLLEYAYVDAQQRGGIVVDQDVENKRCKAKQIRQGLDVDAKSYMWDSPSNLEVLLTKLISLLTKVHGAVTSLEWERSNRILVVGVDSVAGSAAKGEEEAAAAAMKLVEKGQEDKVAEAFKTNPLSLGHAKNLASAFRQIPKLLPKARCALIVVNQSKVKHQMGGGKVQSKTEVTFGGDALKFHATVRLRVKWIGRIEDQWGRPIGMKMAVTPIKNQLAGPWRKAVVANFNDRGIDDHASLYLTLQENQYLLAGNGWERFVCPERGQVAWQSGVLGGFKAACEQHDWLYATALDALWNPDYDSRLKQYLAEQAKAAKKGQG